MSKLCTKISCPNRITIGKKQDSDVINYICPKCENIYFQSESRKKKAYKNLKLASILFLLFGLGFGGWYYYENFYEPSPTIVKTPTPIKKTPEKTMRDFFKNLNAKNYNEAYKSTAHARWNSLEEFKSKLVNWKIFNIKSITRKSYYSKYEADVILNIVYDGIEDASMLQKERNYDFHLKKYGDEWRIARIYLPRKPGIDALKKSELPSSSVKAVRNFLTYLDQKLYKKAYLLTNNSAWKPESKFISNRGFGCIDDIIVYNVRQERNINSSLDIVYARYYASDPCNTSQTHQFYFYVSNKNSYWKIIKATTDLN